MGVYFWGCIILGKFFNLKKNPKANICTIFLTLFYLMGMLPHFCCNNPFLSKCAFFRENRGAWGVNYSGSFAGYNILEGFSFANYEQNSSIYYFLTTSLSSNDPPKLLHRQKRKTVVSHPSPHLPSFFPSDHTCARRTASTTPTTRTSRCWKSISGSAIRSADRPLLAFLLPHRRNTAPPLLTWCLGVICDLE